LFSSGFVVAFIGDDSRFCHLLRCQPCLYASGEFVVGRYRGLLYLRVVVVVVLVIVVVLVVLVVLVVQMLLHLSVR
jgi:hypothetical protein